jgi:uncharacterized protein YutE (UPF0331/DUF86 family)
LVDRDALSSRLSALASYLTELRGFRDVPRERFVREPALHHLAERYLHLAAECAIDLAHHLVSDLGLPLPQTYKETFDVLAAEAVISEELAERLRGWVGFRNVLVHLYLTIDHGISHRAIAEDLGDLEAFAARAARFLE